MNLLETLIVGSYVWTTALVGWLYRLIASMKYNHLQSLEKRVTQLENKIGLE